jgi:hypothetical protein
MAGSFPDLMEKWCAQIKRDLARHWWWPTVGLLIVVVEGSIEHKFYSSINDYIGVHWVPYIAASLSTPLLRILAIAVVLVVVPLLAIVVHAYITTLRSPSGDLTKQASQLPDRIREFSKELAGYLSNRTPRPDEDEIWRKYGSTSSASSSPQLFAEKYNETVQLWDDQVAAGYCEFRKF